jgi:hypothetical protein
LFIKIINLNDLDNLIAKEYDEAKNNDSQKKKKDFIEKLI